MARRPSEVTSRASWAAWRVVRSMPDAHAVSGNS
jgi:hypothetical protein